MVQSCQVQFTLQMAGTCPPSTPVRSCFITLNGVWKTGKEMIKIMYIHKNVGATRNELNPQQRALM